MKKVSGVGSGWARGASVYRGWFVVASLFISGMMVYGAGLYGFTMFIPPLTEEFGWSHAASGGLVSIFWLAAPLAPVGGYCVRRFGPHRLILAAIVVNAACMLTIALAETLYQFYILRAAMGIGKIMLMAGVTAQACNWFGRRFGLVIAICFAGWHFGGLVVAPFTQILIEHFGWRTSCVIVAFAILAICLPPWLLWGRLSRPTGGEDADHGEAALAQTLFTAAVSPVESSALRQISFWVIVAVTMLGGYTYGALITHEVTLLMEIGFSPAWSANALALTAGSAILGTIGIGYLCDRYAFKWVLFAELIVMLLGVGGFLVLKQQPDIALMVLASCLYGVALGGFDTGIIAGLQKLYGSESFKRIFGIWYFFYLLVLFLGPIFAGWVFDIDHSYDRALLLMLIALVVATLLAAIIPGRQAAPPISTNTTAS